MYKNCNQTVKLNNLIVNDDEERVAQSLPQILTYSTGCRCINYFFFVKFEIHAAEKRGDNEQYYAHTLTKCTKTNEQRSNM